MINVIAGITENGILVGCFQFGKIVCKKWNPGFKNWTIVVSEDLFDTFQHLQEDFRGFTIQEF